MAGIRRGGRLLWGWLATLVATLACVGAPIQTASAAEPCDGARSAVSQDADGQDVARVRAAISCLVTQERRRRDLRVLEPDSALRRAATGHSRDMVRRSYFAHVSPGGSDAADRIRRAGYLDRARRWVLGEALAWGSEREASPTAIVKRLMDSPSHRALILGREFREIGVGVALGAPRDDAGPGVTVTLTFGAVSRR